MKRRSRRSIRWGGLRQKIGAAAGLMVAVGGLLVIIVHSTEAALTEHIWLLVGQGMLFGGGLFGLAQLWGGPRR
ncbi:MAG: hypothetical protein ACRDF1_02035 [bacterium]